ncbi:MAG: OmpA family protein [Pseudomonadales bacterium]|nr:OmpA family protein [Pseudomonadales bacterium]
MSESACRGFRILVSLPLAVVARVVLAGMPLMLVSLVWVAGPARIHAAEAEESPVAAAQPPASQGTAMVLGGGIDASWHFFQQNGLCVLEQQIPDFGTARFFGGTGTELVFELMGHRILAAASAVRVRELTPTWHPGFPAWRVIGEMGEVLRNGASGGEPLSGELLMSLYRGYDLELGPFGTQPEVVPAGFNVRIGAQRFRTPYGPFLACTRNPSAYSWADMERTRINHGEQIWQLETEDLIHLEALAQFTRENPSVRAIYVDGHADATGTPAANLALSKRRAETVARALEGFGVPSAMLVLRYHGDRYPVADNATAAGRSANRRTTVQLAREAPAGESEVAGR